jgi:hypothetical protein
MPGGRTPAEGTVTAMSRPSRIPPRLGMPVRVVHLGTIEAAHITAIRDGGRTLVVDGRTFTLRRLNGHFVLDGEPYYGTRLVLDEDAG